MRWRTLFSGYICCLCLLWTTVTVAADRWPLRLQPVRIMTTISTLQYYGPTPGFHHGLDLMAPAGTPIIAPVAGKVSTRYYYKSRSPYTYEVSIQTDDGYRWEFHHVDPGTVPETLEEKAESGGRIEAGEEIGRIFDATTMEIRPHVHINVLNAEGYYQNPLHFLPPLPDGKPPSIRGVYIEPDQGRTVCLDSGTRLTPGRYRLIIDAYDILPPVTLEQSLYALKVFLDGEGVWGFRFDQLPQKSFLEGVGDIYHLSPVHCPGRGVLQNQVNGQAARRFLYSTMIDLSGAKPGQPIALRIQALDFAGNSTEILQQLLVIDRGINGSLDR